MECMVGVLAFYALECVGRMQERGPIANAWKRRPVRSTRREKSGASNDWQRTRSLVRQSNDRDAAAAVIQRQPPNKRCRKRAHRPETWTRHRWLAGHHERIVVTALSRRASRA